MFTIGGKAGGLAGGGLLVTGGNAGGLTGGGLLLTVGATTTGLELLGGDKSLLIAGQAQLELMFGYFHHRVSNPCNLTIAL